MAGSKYAYVKSFELPDQLLPSTFLIARLDGHAFHRFSDCHGFAKPNDERALRLMDHAAKTVMQEFPEITLAFGESDEYSFLFRKSCSLYNRRATKIITTLTSLFTSAYVLAWPQFFVDVPLQYPPSFDGRMVVYPSEKEVRDYFAWRQTDTHINNLYNTTFWALVQQGNQTTTQAHATLRGTVSSQKNEILFSQFRINYNQLPERFRKGSILVRVLIEIPPESDSVASDSPVAVPTTATQEHQTCPVNTNSENADHGSHTKSTTKVSKKKKKSKLPKPVYDITLLHCDIIKETFWVDHPSILSDS